MNLASVRAELEADLAWRQDEVRNLQNRVATIDDDSEKDRFRRPLVLILYAHLEGFCKFSLNVYVNAVNGAGIVCGEADFAIAAASLADLFPALRDTQRKSEEFRNVLPDETKLHRFARDREFVERSAEFEKRPVLILDGAVDTESNLSPIVLKKNLFRLGFDHTRFADKDRLIKKLLDIRNEIGHGSSKSGVSAKLYDEFRDVAFGVMETISLEVSNALKEKAYLRKKEQQQPIPVI